MNGNQLRLVEENVGLEVSLPPSIGTCTQPKLDNDYNLVRYEITRQIPENDRQEAIAQLESVCAPASERKIGELITVMYALTRQRQQEQLTLDLAVAAYAHQLMNYPADIVCEVLTKWPDNNTWWPSWHELKSDLDWRNKHGKLLSPLKENDNL